MGIQVYTGDGKGKTTAALGQALRAIGHGWRVAIVQFLKGSSYTGELFAAARLFPDLTITQFGWGCPYSSLIRSGHMVCLACGECFRQNRRPEHGFAPRALAYARELIVAGSHHMVILDEISHALRHRLLTVEEVLAVLALGKPDTEIILTGRHMPPEIVAVADLVTECRAVKHPYTGGVNSRRGIEY